MRPRRRLLLLLLLATLQTLQGFQAESFGSRGSRDGEFRGRGLRRQGSGYSGFQHRGRGAWSRGSWDRGRGGGQGGRGMRGDYQRRGRGQSNRWQDGAEGIGADDFGAGALELGGGEYEEERQLYYNMESKIIRKISIKRWLEERHTFYPTKPKVERRAIDSLEEDRERLLISQGWEPPAVLIRFKRAPRTNWEALANQPSQGGNGITAGSMDLADTDSSECSEESEVGADQYWNLRLKGGGNDMPVFNARDTSRPKGGGYLKLRPSKGEPTVPAWRRIIDEVACINFRASDGKLIRTSLSGLLFDCIIASQLLMVVQLLVDMLVAIPVLKIFSAFLIPVLLPAFGDFPRLAEFSITIAHWGVRLSRCVLSSILAGWAFARFAQAAYAFRKPLIPVLWATYVNLSGTWACLRKISTDERFNEVVSFWGICLRVLTCEIPALLLFAWTAFRGAHGEELNLRQIMGIDALERLLKGKSWFWDLRDSVRTYFDSVNRRSRKLMDKVKSDRQRRKSRSRRSSTRDFLKYGDSTSDSPRSKRGRPANDMQGFRGDLALKGLRDDKEERSQRDFAKRVEDYNAEISRKLEKEFAQILRVRDGDTTAEPKAVALHEAEESSQEFPVVMDSEEPTCSIADIWKWGFSCFGV